MSPGRPALALTFPLALGGHGGGTVGCLRIAEHLHAQGAEVVLLPTDTMAGFARRRPPLTPEQRGDAVAEALRAQGIEVQWVHRAAHYALDCRAMARAVAALVARRRIDAVLGWNHQFATLPRWLRRRGIASLMFAAGKYDELKRPRPWTRRGRGHLLQRWLIGSGMRRADRVLAISAFARAHVLDVFGLDPARVEVVRWGVSALFAGVPRQPAGAIERFVFYGSPDPRKGALDAIAAFAAARRSGFTAGTLKVIWQHEAQVREAAAEHGIAGQVIALPPMPHRDLVEELAWAQVAILPSRYESLGLACIEAQTAGLPVIAYANGGVGEAVLDGETGWLVPNGRADLLVAPILAATRDPPATFAMGIRGRERARREFSWESCAARILQLVASPRGS